MTIDEAIKRCLEAAENCEEQAKQCDSDDRYERHVMHENAKCAAEKRQLAKWLTELKEAKRLLKAAVEDINWINEHTQDEDGSCIMRTNSGCSGCPLNINGDLFCKWKHAYEAIKLIEKGEQNCGR